MDSKSHDPKGLIREAYVIEGITDAECRSIFLDWALSLPDGMDQKTALQALCDLYAIHQPDHPMSVVMKMGLTQISTPQRRGGWRGRKRN
jgi:hypothetical protein